jgi:hypothetical protein
MRDNDALAAGQWLKIPLSLQYAQVALHQPEFAMRG